MTHTAFDIRGRTALVTGSSRGIGLALAGGLVASGCSVALHARDPQALEQAAAALAPAAERAGGRVHHVSFDVTDRAAVDAGVAAVEAELGPLDILVNNAGMQHRATLLDFPDDAWQRVIDTNLTSAFYVGRAAARGMIERGRGKIVNIGSLQSELARAGTAPYAASKGGIKMLTRAMCAEWAPAGLQVNAIGPGYFDTELTSALVQDEQFDAWLRRRTPAARWGRPEELVGTLLYLASPASDFVNGQILYVDGGMSAVL
jgi:gluconate 5-dehydrogenase